MDLWTNRENALKFEQIEERIEWGLVLVVAAYILVLGMIATFM